MTEQRTIIVPGPHGPLTVFEPDWCTGHGQDNLDWQALTHLGEESDITIDTPAGGMAILSGQLFQQVWPGAGNGTDVMYGLDLTHSAVNCTPGQLRAIYRSAVDQFRQLLDWADRLDALRGGGR
jgi:hypothetical protein